MNALMADAITGVKTGVKANTHGTDESTPLVWHCMPSGDLKCCLSDQQCLVNGQVNGEKSASWHKCVKRFKPECVALGSMSGSLERVLLAPQKTGRCIFLVCIFLVCIFLFLVSFDEDDLVPEEAVASTV